MFRKFLCALLSVLMLLSATPVGAAETISIAIFFGEPQWVNEWGPQINPCALQAGVDIEVRPSAFPPQILLWTASGDAPDIALIQPERIGSIAYQDVLEDLRPWVERSGLDMEAWLPTAREAMEYRGRWIGLPAYVVNYTYAYNTALMQQRGLVPPAVNEWVTWETVLANARKATYDQDGDGVPEVIGFVNGATFEQFLPLVRQAGGDFFSDDLMVTLNTPAVHEAVEFVLRMNQEGIHSDNRTLFWTGAAATERLGSWEVRRLLTNDISAGAAAGIQHARKSDVAYVTMWTMLKDAKNKEAAWRFLTCLMTPESQNEVVKRGTIPMRRDVDVQLAAMPELFQGFLNTLEFSGNYPYHPEADHVRNEFNARTAGMFTGEAAPASVLSELERTLNAHIRTQLGL